MLIDSQKGPIYRKCAWLRGKSFLIMATSNLIENDLLKALEFCGGKCVI